MKHLEPEELIDALDGTLAAERRAHLASCEVCRQELNGVSSALNDAKQASIPEPSPLFWNHLSERVRDAIDTESSQGAPWPSWLRWQMLAPVGALAMLLLTLMIAVPKHPAPDAIVGETPASAEPSDASSDGWGVVADIVGDFDLETAAATGVIEPGTAELAVLSLTREEQQELTRLLEAELTRAKS